MQTLVGIDIGSVSVAVVEVSAGGEIMHTAYRMHGGHTAATLTRLLQGMTLNRIAGVAATSSTPPLIRCLARHDPRLAVIRAARYFYQAIGAILLVGGEKFGLIRFDADGQYHGFKANTACAAGTGSFLDQQALRLGLADSSALGELALQNKGPAPRIASRCAVFAKTDLIHAQQEGYALEAICDGLCYGLARNIVDTLFTGDSVLNPILFAGGVSKNQAVVAHVQRLLGQPIAVHPQAHLFGALGAALSLADRWPSGQPLRATSVQDLLLSSTRAKTYYYAPLALHLSDYPDFDVHDTYLFTSEMDSAQAVEVDNYGVQCTYSEQRVFLGVDIGSTSTKAVLLTLEREVLAGFYTRTAGRPLMALQAILSAIDGWQSRQKTRLQIQGAGTTGSGRKFIGRAMGADLVLDEISAHARAACQLAPQVDTIIEIGGQDAKFTTLENGQVTFAAMNTVCAAGTGSFIEEQAQQLGCALTEINARTQNQRAPLASDRCTVFMEGDLHHYLSEGYTVDEVLAAVLHSIRENYLTKVAVEAKIGDTILFQGATAKNRALVAAFEQRLGKPIHVSRYCHLAGALGVALSLADQGVAQTQFRGINLHKRPIPLNSEVCDYCPNHCKISVMEIDGRKVAYGFLCGRDYDTPRRVHRNPSGFDLLRARQRAFAFEASTTPRREKRTVGIPAALHLVEDMAMWQYFFDRLGITTVTTEDYSDAIREGKHAAGAEFCSPMTALHGHVQYLLGRADYIFLPYYLETRSGGRGIRRQYCYYTQYAAPLASAVDNEKHCPRFLMPLVYYLYNPFHTKAQLYRTLKRVVSAPVSFMAVSTAYDQALAFKGKAIEKLKQQYARATRRSDDIHVVLLGRPYTVLSSFMNKSIPTILANLGIKTFFQDMLSPDPQTLHATAPLRHALHWHYAAAILSAAETVAQTPGAYPVFVTAFKCSPDSFVSEYFKSVMGAYGKPYLVLQVDEHDTTGGYETRIEAAIRSFRNHHARGPAAAIETAAYAPALVPIKRDFLFGKTLLLPNWDPLALPLIAAALQKEGIDARLLEESPASIQKSLRHNTGQCIPLNIIAQNVIDYIEKYNLNPAKTALWVAASSIACNIHLYPVHIRKTLEAYGKGLEHTGIYLGPVSLQDISLRLPPDVYFAYMCGGYLRRMGCRLRPNEMIKGRTDRVMAESLALLVSAFQERRDKEAVLAQVIELFESIAITPARRPKVAIFGDLYTRDNDVINQGLIGCIEANGGEALTMPYSDYLKIIAKPYMRKWLIEGHYLTVLSAKLFSLGLKQQESNYYKYFQRILQEPEPIFDPASEKIFSQYNLRIENTGESMDNILKIHHLIGQHPDIALLVQTGPAYCCPALVTEAMARRIEKNTGVPMVSITYDGTGGNQNEAIIPYLHYARAGVERRLSERPGPGHSI